MNRLLMACTAAVVSLSSSARGQTIWYVNEVADSGNSSCSTWQDACPDLQDALSMAGAGDEIWVAAGTYRPDGGSAERLATFQLSSGVALYGGFDGSESALSNRAGLFDLTILSGDLAQNDGPDFENNSDNSYHVVTGSGADESALLDGFTITGGNAAGLAAHDFGGGMYNINGSPTVRNCYFIANSAYEDGGGMYNWGNSNPAVVDCGFFENSSMYGGGMANYASSPAVTNCDFRENFAHMGGGGMDNAGGSNPTVLNCTFVQNSADRGGAVSNWWNGNPVMINCAMTHNEASDYGGGMYNAESSPMVINCSFSGNTASGYGGAVANDAANVAVTNCILWGDSPDELHGGGAIVKYSAVEGGYSGSGNIDLDPLCVDPPGGDLRLRPGSPCIDAGDNVSLLSVAIALGGVMPSGDLDCRARFMDVPGVGDIGIGAVVDMGAYEFPVFQPHAADLNQDGVVDAADLGQLLGAWGPHP